MMRAIGLRRWSPLLSSIKISGRWSHASTGSSGVEASSCFDDVLPPTPDVGVTADAEEFSSRATPLSAHYGTVAGGASISRIWLDTRAGRSQPLLESTSIGRRNDG